MPVKALRRVKTQRERQADAQNVSDIVATYKNGSETPQRANNAEITEDSMAADGMIDKEAETECRTRLGVLEEEIAAAQKEGLTPRVSELREQKSRIEKELKNARPLGGTRNRKVADPAKNDADAVRNALNRELADLKKAHPNLWKHLDEALQIGSTCRYQPVGKEVSGQKSEISTEQKRLFSHVLLTSDL